MMLEWEWLWGEWVLFGFRRSAVSGGWYQIGRIYLSTFGPPFRYRKWDREGKDWERSTLDHCTTLDEAKACLAVSLRMT